MEITFENLWEEYGNLPYGLELSWHLPEGLAVSSDAPRRLCLPHRTTYTKGASVVYRTRITAGEQVELRNRPVLEVVIDGRPTVGYIPFTLMG